MNLLEHVDTYFRTQDLENSTMADYRWVAGAFTSWTGCLALETLSVEEATKLVNDWVFSLRDGRSPWTLHGYRGKVLVLWRSAYRWGLTQTIPDPLRTRKVKKPRLNPEGWNREEMQRLVHFCETGETMRRKMRNAEIEVGHYLAALFRFLWNTGMRLGDALDVELDDLKGGQIVWRQNKTDIWHRADLWPSTILAIERIRTPARRFVWHQPSKGRRSLFRTIALAVQKAGLRGTSKFARRGGATEVENRTAGMAPTYLGHVPGSRIAYQHYVSQESMTRTASPQEL